VEATRREAGVRRFRCGLVVGKFSPLHRGHEALIRFAQAACDSVIVISYCKPELAGCDAGRRAAWIAEIFPAVRSLVVTDELLRQRGKAGDRFVTLPHGNAPDDEHREFCAFLLESHLGAARVDAVFTSEDYGDGFATHLTRHFRSRDPSAPAVEHVCMDRNRVRVPISASVIRSDVHANRQWLPPCVYASFVERVCILGGESSGKSVLARALAERLDTAFVAEYARDLWMRKSGRLDYEDLLHIARQQISHEQSAARQAYRYLFCDTSPLTTLFYSLDMFGRAEEELRLLARRLYEKYVLCAPDFEFVQDGTRRDATFRQRQHEWYVEQLNGAGVRYLLAEGPIAARVERIAELLEGEGRG
jgi:HTH-type transcriptional regulator, transcriptional repressor of NAD biosynthesis genes